jgi:hypothetical protein
MNVLTPLLLGADSLIGAAAVGPLLPRGRRWPVVALFGACDGLATLLAATGAVHLPRPMGALVPVAVALYGGYLLLTSAGVRQLGSGAALAVPVLFSLDNLVAGSQGAAVPGVVLAVLSSSLLAAVGLLIGQWAGRRTTNAPQRLAGGVLLAAAVLTAV